MRTRNHRTTEQLIVSIAAGLLMATATATATAATPTDRASKASGPDSAKAALVAFMQCDQSFFARLSANPQSFGPAVAVSATGGVASPTVPDPLSEQGQVQTFRQPVEVDGLKLMAYRNEVSYDDTMGAFVWWGFDVEGSETSVAKVVNQLLNPEQRLVKTNGYWARGEYRQVSDPLDAWQRGGQGSGTVTAKGSVERVLLIEKHETKGRVKLYCTLQGSVTSPLLQLLRPDLPASAHR